MPFPDESFASRVAVVPSRPGWAAEAAALRERVLGLWPAAVRVDHIGSTAVPGLPAKDCIDLMVQVARLDDAVDAALTGGGFRRRPEPWNNVEETQGTSHPKMVFAAPAGERLGNLQVRVEGGTNVRYALLFRDFLRACPPDRATWGGFKTRLAASVPDLADYGQVKAAVQPLLMSHAERWSADTGWTAAAAREL